MATLRLKVLPYDSEHERMLEKSRYSARIRELFQRGLTVTESDVLIHTVFEEQKDYPGWRTYHDLAARAGDREAIFREYFDLASGTIRAKFPPSDGDTKQTEKLGVACALLTVNE